MFDEWTASTWLILLVDIVAIAIVVMFSSGKFSTNCMKLRLVKHTNDCSESELRPL